MSGPATSVVHEITEINISNVVVLPQYVRFENMAADARCEAAHP